MNLRQALLYLQTYVGEGAVYENIVAKFRELLLDTGLLAGVDIEWQTGAKHFRGPIRTQNIVTYDLDWYRIHLSWCAIQMKSGGWAMVPDKKQFVFDSRLCNSIIIRGENIVYEGCRNHQVIFYTSGEHLDVSEIDV